MQNIKLISLLLALATVNSAAVAQQKLPKAAEAAVKAYESKIEAIQKEQEARRLEARTELDQILLTQQKEALAAGETAAAQRIERERADIKAINDRIDLHDALVGHTYKWESNRNRWTFNSDGTITADDSKFPWVTLNGNEVLLMMNDGSLRILLFNEDRTNCRVGFLPPTKAGKNTLKLIK
jgi:hypothetical protein